MSNVLIASLGKSPIVVTAMVKALKEVKGIQLDQVDILYPEQIDIDSGIELIEKHCVCKNVVKRGLPFKDANSEENCIFFLQTLYGILEEHKEDAVYLSLTGGRKNMSALMYLLAPFYPNIKGVYHILDKNEGTRNTNFHDIDDLLGDFLIDSPELEPYMNPPTESLSLVEMPFEHFADADDLRNIILENDFTEFIDDIPVDLEEISPEGAEFWKSIFTKKKPQEQYNIWFSENAKKQFESPNVNKIRFGNYFKKDKLKNPDWANKSDTKNGGKHATFNGEDRSSKFFIAKNGDTAERVAWYKKSENDIVISELSTEDDRNRYIIVGGHVQLNKVFFSDKTISDYEAKYRLHELPYFGEAILLATLGKSPMIVTQACTLLEHFENVKIEKVVLFYPRKNRDIRNGVDILKDVFQRKHMDIIPAGVEIEDVNDDHACRLFISMMIQKINDLKKEKPDVDMRLLISGGRKGMSALALLAAQVSHLPHVYHTLITDPELEESIEERGTIDEINRLRSVKERSKFLFMEAYKDSLEKNFALFKIPVIPLILNLS